VYLGIFWGLLSKYGNFRIFFPPNLVTLACTFKAKIPLYGLPRGENSPKIKHWSSHERTGNELQVSGWFFHYLKDNWG
jgi:hypothetical protein